MKQTYLYVSIHLIIQAGIPSGIHAINPRACWKPYFKFLNVQKEKATPSWNEVNLEPRVSALERPFMEEHPATIQAYKSNEFDLFWNQSRNLHCLKNSYPLLYRQMNALLISEKDTWAKDVEIIFLKIASRETNTNHISELIILFKVLIDIINFFKVPLNAVQEIWGQLHTLHKKIISLSHTISRQVCLVNLDITLRTYAARLISQLGLLEIEKDYDVFCCLKRRFEFHGVKLAGEWSVETERDLFILWMKKYDTYFSISDNFFLQQVIETQFVQRELIEAIQKVPNPQLHLVTDFMDWVQATLDSHSQLIVRYIKSLKNESDYHKFLKIQSDMTPYGFDVKIDCGETKQKIQVIQFWVTYVLVFSRMNNPGEPDSLRIVVEELVRMNFQETSMIMKEFLIKAKNCIFTQDEPVLAHFLKYLSRRSKSQDLRNHARFNFNKFSLQMRTNAKLQAMYTQS